MWFVLGKGLRKDCACELQPVLPSHYNQITHSNNDKADTLNVQTGLCVVLGIPDMHRASNTILDSIERGGPTVSFTATVQRVLCQSAATGVRYVVVYLTQCTTLRRLLTRRVVNS